MRYTHIIFDIDGTLLDTEYAVLHSLQKTIRTVTGLDTGTEQLTFALGIPGEETLARLGIPEIPYAMKIWLQYLHDLGHTARLFDGIEDVLEALSRQGCHLGIVTSQQWSLFQSDFGQRPVSRYFETIICADDTRRHKPFPEPLLCYMEKTKTSPSELLYVGDSKYDMACARDAHVDFALAGWGSQGRVEASCILREPKDLLKKNGL